LMGTGTEVTLCVSAYEQLKAEGVKARVVSIPSWNLFDQQSDEYKAKVLPPEIKARVSVEQAATFGWSQYIGPTGIAIGMRRFGASAPIKDLQKKFGFTTENVVAAARKAMGK
jgi:transketolase